MSDSNTSDSTFNLATVIEDAKKVILNPVGFYKEMPTTGGYSNPLIFVVVMAVIAGLILSVYAVLGFGSAAMAGGMAIGAVIIVPIFAAIGSFIAAAIIFIIWKLMGSDKNYETAYRCVAYSMAIAPVFAAISFIPYIATIIRVLWFWLLMYIASIEVHSIKDSTAKIVFGILAALFVLGGISGEKAQRNASKYLSSWSEAAQRGEYKAGSLGKAMQDMPNVEDMTPEEAGKQFGEFLKGMEQFSKGLEESAKENN